MFTRSPQVLEDFLYFYILQSTKLFTTISCSRQWKGNVVSSLACNPFLSLQSPQQIFLFLAVLVQYQSSVMDLNNSGSSLSPTSRDLLHALISHWIHSMTQEKAQNVKQCLIWSGASGGGRSAFKRFDKEYFWDNECSYTEALSNVEWTWSIKHLLSTSDPLWNKSSGSSEEERLGFLARLRHLEALGFVSPPRSTGGKWDAGNTLLLRETLWEGERKLLSSYEVCQMISEKMWYHSYALPSWRGAAHLGSHLELTYNSFGLVWALSETAPYAVFT